MKFLLILFLCIQSFLFSNTNKHFIVERVYSPQELEDRLNEYYYKNYYPIFIVNNLIIFEYRKQIVNQNNKIIGIDTNIVQMPKR